MTKNEVAKLIAGKAKVGMFQLLEDFPCEIEDMSRAKTQEDFDDVVEDWETVLEVEIKRLIAIKRTVISLEFKEVHNAQQ